MAWTSPVSCSSHATVCYSMEQAISMVMDNQSPNVLAADSDSGSVWEFLCLPYSSYCEWIVNKLFKNTKHVHSINSMTSKSNLISKPAHFMLHSVVFKVMYRCLRLDEWLKKYSILKLKVGSDLQCSTPAQVVLSCSVLLYCWFPGIYFACTAGNERIKIGLRKVISVFSPWRGKKKHLWQWLFFRALSIQPLRSLHNDNLC